MFSKRLLLLACLAVLAIAQLALIAAPAQATSAPTKPDVKFQVGDWIIQGGEAVGCKCGKTSGPCVCQLDSQR